MLCMRSREYRFVSLALPCASLQAAVCVAWILISALPLYAGPKASSVSRPNIVWITSEDLSPVLGCYGDRYAVTPHLDRLAEQGIRYTHAFASASVCTPARSSLITGIFASSLGTQHLRGPQPLATNVRCFTEYLREAGYYCSNNVKEDYNFATPKTAWDESSRTAHWRNRQNGQLFFSVFNLMTTHQSRIRFPEDQFRKLTARLEPSQRHDPQRALLPPYYPDTPLVRHDVAQLYDLVTAADRQVQDLLDQLKEDGLSDNTIVFYYADHGTGMPRHKRWLYDSGIRVPLIIRFPNEYRYLAPGDPGTISDRLVSFVDFAPTVLSLTGLRIPDTMQGRAFLGRQAAEPRQRVFAIRDRVDEVVEMSRTVRERRYQYLRNFLPHRPRMQHSDYSERTPTRKEFRRLAAEDKLTGAARDFLSPVKAPEELYDTVTDPHQIHNLAADPKYHDILVRLRNDLHQWMIRTRDTGLLPEIEMLARSVGGSPYDMALDAGRFDPAATLAAAELVGRGPAVCDQMSELLTSSDAALRYWAATGLAALGSDARPARAALLSAMKDDAPHVQFAAAEALCNLGDEAHAVPVLTAGLEDDSPLVRLYAAAALVSVGSAAQSAELQIRAALAEEPARGTYSQYTRWALARVLSQLGD